MSRRSRSWWVSAKMTPAGDGWHWKFFFSNPVQNGSNWGGAEWIQSDTSRARIEEMRAGDFILCYQAGEGIVGIAQLKSGGYKSKGSERFDMFDLRVKPALWLESPIPLSVVKSLPRARETFEFVRGTRGTAFSIEPGGFERAVALAIAFDLELSSRLVRLVF